jgi:hypothetical protein
MFHLQASTKIVKFNPGKLAGLRFNGIHEEVSLENYSGLRLRVNRTSKVFVHYFRDNVSGKTMRKSLGAFSNAGERRDQDLAIATARNRMYDLQEAK